MPDLTAEAQAWIETHGIAGVLMFARSSLPRDVAAERFISHYPGSDPAVLESVFGIALQSVAAAQAMTAPGSREGASGSFPPQEPGVPTGRYRYRFTVTFVPAPGDLTRRTVYKSFVFDSPAVLTQAELEIAEQSAVDILEEEYNLGIGYLPGSADLDAITVG